MTSVIVRFNDRCFLQAIRHHAQRLTTLAGEFSGGRYAYREAFSSFGTAEFSFVDPEAASAFSLAANDLAERYRFRIISEVRSCA